MEEFFKDGLRFECSGCSACCRMRGGVVFLSGEDLSRLAEFEGLSESQFEKAFCRKMEADGGRTYLCLRDKNSSDCVFWNCGCDVYEARPVQCRTYPFWTKILADENSWNGEKKFCPGINEGAIHSEAEIKSALSEYEENKLRLK